MEIKLQQKASSSRQDFVLFNTLLVNLCLLSRLEHLEILYEKEKIQEGADLYALHKVLLFSHCCIRLVGN